jgi:hypothetical protein
MHAMVRSRAPRSSGGLAGSLGLALVLAACTADKLPPNVQGADGADAGMTGGGGGGGSGGGTARDASTPPPGMDASTPPPPQTCREPLPGAAPIRLLTRSEYDNTVRDLLGVDLAPARDFPPENAALGFDNNAEAHLVSPLLAQKYIDAAETLAARAVETRLDALLACDVEAQGLDACVQGFVRRFGRRAFRRPLSTDEAERFERLGLWASSRFDLRTGIELVIGAFLESPQFLYRIEELTRADAPGVTVTIGGYEMASRLSYFLWNTMPDDALLEAAGRGVLDTVDGVEAQARRMLADPRARLAVRDFHRQWLEIDKIVRLEKDLEHRPGGVGLGGGIEHLREVWTESLQRFMEHVFFESSDPIGALFGSPIVYLDADTARLYGTSAPGAELVPVMMPAGERAGLLTQPALMARLAHPEQTSPIHRGIFVREKLMCQALPPPPADIVIEAPEPDPNATTRERFAQHTEDPTCQACHVMIDPIGFGFEAFDELGRFRTMENGKNVDTSGRMVGAIEGAVNGDFRGVVELAARLSQSRQVTDCVAEQWYRYAMGRGARATEADRCALAEVQGALRTAGGDLRELLVALTKTAAFRARPGVEVTTAPPLPEDPDGGVATDAGPGPSPDASMPPMPDAGSPQGPDQGRVPEGFLDSIDAAGVIRGWTLDRDTPDYPLYVEVFLDDVPGRGQMIHSFRASRPRPDVNQVTGVSGDHGFEEQLPAWVLDGQPHRIWVLAYNTGRGGNGVLSNSPLAFTLGTLNRPPIGAFDAVTPAGVAAGWTLDPDEPTRQISVHFYVDGPAGSGTFLGAVNATLPRPDVNQVTGFPGDHGFGFTLPAIVRDGRPHVLHAYAIDSAGGRNPELPNSPITFTLGN